MPRPKNKKELLDASDKNFNKLWTIIDSIDDEQKQNDFKNDALLNKNIRDVLCHLYHWHLMFLDWYKIGMKGTKPEMPSPGYKWKDTALLNIEVNKKYTTTTLVEAQKLVKKSHAKVHSIIAKHSYNELFEKKKYAWTGSTSLGQYLISNTSSHYDWAIRIIKRGIKN